jgi:hypothetical protein
MSRPDPNATSCRPTRTVNERGDRPVVKSTNERLMELETIFVGRTGTASAARLESALNLGKDANMSTGDEIGMDEIPL